MDKVMVSLEGTLRPLRINKEELVDLLKLIEPKLKPDFTSRVGFYIHIERFSHTCENLDELNNFLKDVRLPNVAKDFWGYTNSTPKVTLFFHFDSARYEVEDAVDMEEARAIEDLILEFFKKHSVYRLFSPWVAFPLGIVLFLLAVIELANVGESMLLLESLANRPIHFLVGVCSITFLSYIVWSIYTKDTPSFSFVHSILYLKDVRSHAIWYVVSTILGGIAVSAIWVYLEAVLGV